MGAGELTDAAPAAGSIRLRRQLLTCAAMCTLAAIVLAWRDAWSGLFAGPAWYWQGLLGLGVGACAGLSSWIGMRRQRDDAATRHMVESYRRLDLSGWNPLWIGLAAGVGEELLFRGALQPWLGIWATTLLFVLAHVRAYRMRKFDRMLLKQVAGLVAASLVLGLIARYAGLLSAILVHALVDVVGLLAIRHLSARDPLAAATA